VNESFMAWLSPKLAEACRSLPKLAQALSKPAEGDTGPVNESFMVSPQVLPKLAQALPKPAEGDTEAVNESFMAWLSPLRPAQASRSQPKATQRG